MNRIKKTCMAVIAAGVVAIPVMAATRGGAAIRTSAEDGNNFTTYAPSAAFGIFKTYDCDLGDININGISGAPITLILSSCDVRVWFHQFTGNESQVPNWQQDGGWAFCVSPHQVVDVPSWAQRPRNFYVSYNTENCPT